MGTVGSNGLNNQMENTFLVKNDVFGSEITQINKFDQFLEVWENSKCFMPSLRLPVKVSYLDQTC